MSTSSIPSNSLLKTNIQLVLVSFSTNTDKYLDFRSNHPTCHKLSVVDALVNRAMKICDEETLDTELTHTKNVLMMNNYPKTLIEKRIDRMKILLNDPNVTQTRISSFRVSAPYYTELRK